MKMRFFSIVMIICFSYVLHCSSNTKKVNLEDEVCFENESLLKNDGGKILFHEDELLRTKSKRYCIGGIVCSTCGVVSGVGIVPSLILSFSNKVDEQVVFTCVTLTLIMVSTFFSAIGGNWCRKHKQMETQIQAERNLVNQLV